MILEISKTRTEIEIETETVIGTRVGVDGRLQREGDATSESVKAYTYGVSTVGGVLDLGLMQLHLLLRQHRLHFRMLLADDLEEVLGEHLGALDLLLVRAADSILADLDRGYK